MHERTDERSNPLSNAYAAEKPGAVRPDPVMATHPLIEGLQIIAGSAPVCGPDDLFCELPPFDVTTAQCPL